MKRVKRLVALISAALAVPNKVVSAYEVEHPTIDGEGGGSNSVGVLNPSVSPLLAAHGSHRSHGSHGSHRSSSGGVRPPPVPAPRTAPPPPQPSDPTGQPARPAGSYPSQTEAEVLAKKMQDKEARKNVIMRMQLTLKFENYYDGPIDGVMGPDTRAAVLKYKKDKGIPGDTVLDANTLNSLGILGF